MIVRGVPVFVPLVLAIAVGGALDDGVAASRPEGEGEFERAVGAYRAGRVDEAIERIRRVLDRHPDDADAVWNLGLWEAEAGRHERALAAWNRYRELAPDDWRGRAKRVQSLQALGRGEARDREIASLSAVRAAGRDPALAALESFCRDQFGVGEDRVLALQRFEPGGERPVVLEFVVLDRAGEERGRYRLASWDAYNDVAWEESEITRPHRTYELSWRSDSGRRRVTWYEGGPEYERVRRDVVRDLAARVRRGG